MSKSVEAVKYAKEKGLYIAFGAEDSTRTNDDFIIKLYKAVYEAGADIVAIVDTVSQLTPVDVYRKVQKYKKELNEKPLSVHLHNDFGMATANAVSAVLAGADQIQTTINGLGERAGSPSIQEVVMALNVLTDRKLIHINTSMFKHLSKYMEKCTGILEYPLSPIIGDYAFSHESGLHVSSMLNDDEAYEAFSPDLVGMERKYVAGKHAGKNVIKYILEKEFGVINLHEKDIEHLVKDVKRQAALSKTKFSSADILDMYKKMKGDFIMIREANKNDAKVFYELYDELRGYVEKGCEKPTIEEYETLFALLLEDESYKLWKIMDGENVAGVIVINERYNLFHCKKIVYVDEIVITEEKRGKGFGRKALDYVCEYYRKKGNVVKVELSTDYNNTQARGFYSNIGFDDYAALYKVKTK